MSIFDQTSLITVRELCAQATHKAKTLRDEAEKAAHVEKVWEDLTLFLSRGWPIHVRSLMDTEKSIFQQMRAEEHASISQLEEVYRRAKDEGERLLRRFP